MFESDEGAYPTIARLPETLFIPEQIDLTFSGFGKEAFEILDRLKTNPHIEQYRREKEGIQHYLMSPFREYRDDLVINLVLPNTLPLETERNVFSRLLKNDFGAGGCHHHLWMSFYRPGYTRLRDIQLPHSIDPAGFSVGLYLGAHAPSILKDARRRIETGRSEFVVLVSELLSLSRWQFNYYLGTGAAEESRVVTAPLNDLPAEILKATGLWFRAQFERDEVIEWGGELLSYSLRAMQVIWPLYLFFVGGVEANT